MTLRSISDVGACREKRRCADWDRPGVRGLESMLGLTSVLGVNDHLFIAFFGLSK